MHCLLCTLSWFSFQSFSICHDHEFYHVSFCGFHIFASFLISSFALRIQFWILINPIEMGLSYLVSIFVHIRLVSLFLVPFIYCALISFSSVLDCLFQFRYSIFPELSFCFDVLSSYVLHYFPSRWPDSCFSWRFFLDSWMIVTETWILRWFDFLSPDARDNDKLDQNIYDQNWTLELGTSKTGTTYVFNESSWPAVKQAKIISIF